MTNRCAYLSWLAAAALASSAPVQGQEEAGKPAPIVLRPAAAPVPALKYSLLPERPALVSGNAAIFYHRAVEMSLYRRSREQRAWKAPDASRNDANLVESWVNGALSAIPQERARHLIDSSREALHEIDLGARRQTCNWEFEQRDEAVSMLVEEIQQMRSLIWMVSLRARLAVLDGRIDEAVHWIQNGFAMARHASQGPLLIQSLVGVTLSQVMCKPLEDLIQAPGSPSLYWALRAGRGRLSSFRTALKASVSCWSVRSLRCAS